MAQKNRLIFTIAVILLIFCALAVSFGRNLFRMNTPDVVLPNVNAPTSEESTDPGQSTTNSQQTVAVTPKTVQSVIATLLRSDSYYRELLVEQFWQTGSASSTVKAWVDGEWSHIQQTLPNGAIRNDLIGADTVYYWYSGYSHYESAPADLESADLAQRLPTYETVLELDADRITAAGYELKGEMPCIYVEFTEADAPITKHYWVSVDSGLLVCAELYQDEFLTYRMTAFTPIQSPCPANASFKLPDGTTLHTL